MRWLIGWLLFFSAPRHRETRDGQSLRCAHVQIRITAPFCALCDTSRRCSRAPLQAPHGLRYHELLLTCTLVALESCIRTTHFDKDLLFFPPAGGWTEGFRDGSTATIECRCLCGSNSVCRQAKAHPPTLLSIFPSFLNTKFMSFAKGPREQIGLCEVPTAAECNVTKLLHIRGQESNSRGGGRATGRQQQLFTSRWGGLHFYYRQSVDPRNNRATRVRYAERLSEFPSGTLVPGLPLKLRQVVTRPSCSASVPTISLALGVASSARHPAR